MPRGQPLLDADYLASMCSEFAKIAAAQGYDHGAYLLEMAALEFQQVHARLDLTLAQEA